MIDDQSPHASGATVTILGRTYRLGATYVHRAGASGPDRRLTGYFPSMPGDDPPTDGRVNYSSGGSSHSCTSSDWVAWAGAVR